MLVTLALFRAEEVRYEQAGRRLFLLAEGNRRRQKDNEKVLRNEAKVAKVAVLVVTADMMASAAAICVAHTSAA